MKIVIITLAILLLFYGIYRFLKGNRAEGLGEIIAVIFELIGEILGALS
jgi:hypothetical protein